MTPRYLYPDDEDLIDADLYYALDELESALISDGDFDELFLDDEDECADE